MVDGEIPLILAARRLFWLFCLLLCFLAVPHIAQEATADRTFYPLIHVEVEMPDTEVFIGPLENAPGPTRSYGNGSCMPYARERSGINVFGSACTIWERAGALGLATSTIPIVGGVIVTTEGNCGHVAVVESIDGDNLLISEQNYKGIYLVSDRVIDRKAEMIVGYIY